MKMISQEFKNSQRRSPLRRIKRCISAIDRLEGGAEVEVTDDVVETKRTILKTWIPLHSSKCVSWNVCLDECHHLRNEWWKSLETFRKILAGYKCDFANSSTAI